ncbi:sensor histidine kinase [Actinoplanes xinjiangensis]|uniref:sensor histidine kinase n=1 Tax=Actinoplanes xinjiangensis TaxID=512350 RepID=UPI003424D69A
MGEVVLYRSERTLVLRRSPSDRHGALIRKRATGPGAVRRIRHEQEVLRRLAGIPGVPRLAAGQSRQTLVLEDDGGVPPDRGRLAVPLLLNIAADLAATLAAVHRAGVVHRDITPANVVLAGRAVLIDFDLALLGRSDTDEPGGPVGTLGYLAPEQTGRIGPVADSRADLYGLGATLYTLAAGEPPFSGDDPLELVRDTLVRPPVPVGRRRPGLPPRFCEIIMRLLEKDPERRYQSADGLAYDLARCRAGPDDGWVLGERDFPAFLAPPPELIGREPEIGTLTAALDRAMHGGTPAVLISGPPGIGKSALARYLRPMITARGGWFADGRFDQFRTGTDTGGITRALRVLTRLLLAAPEPEVAEARQRIPAALGANVAVVRNAIPEMTDLLGAGGGPHPGDPVTARGRVSAAAVALLRAFAARRRIVLVLDDLQWASGGSMQVLESILAAGPVPGLLLVITFRDGHPSVRETVDRWQHDGVAGPEIHLEGLGPAETATVVATVLRMPPEEAPALSALIRQSSGGNPYATVELLNALRADGLLRPADGGWRWDAGEVRAFVSRHRLAQLPARRLAQQAEGCRRRYAALACLGGEVTVDLLAAASGTPLDDLNRHVDRAVADGFVLRAGNTVRFRYDLVLQAARECLPEPGRRALQLAMARGLSRDFPQAAAEQYLAVVSLVENPQERREAAALLHAAARRTIRLTNYPVAVDLLDAAEQLLAGAGDDLARNAVAVDRHITYYCLGRLDDADRVYRELAGRSPDPVTLTEATAIQINVLSQRNENRAAYALGLDVLRRFGIEPPDDPEPLVRREVAALRAGLGDLEQAAETVDPAVLAVGRLINRLLVPAYQLGPMEHSWMLLQAYRLWRREGVCPPVVGAAGSAICATIFLFDDYRTGYRLCRYVVAVGREHGWAAETAIARYMHLFLAAHWFEPLEDIVEAGQQTRDDLLAAGDVQVAGLISARLASVVLETADSLDTVAEEIAAGLATAERTGNRIAGFNLTTYRDLVRAVRGQEALDEVPVLSYPPALATYHVNHGLIALFRQDDAALAEHSAAAMVYCQAIRGFYASALARVLHCLSLAGRLRDGDTGVAAELADVRDWLARRSTDAPRNFRPLLHLVDAERAWARGDPDTAARHFDAGLHEVAGRPWHRAVLAERAARFHLERGLTHTAHRLLAEARDTYRAWGAVAPVDRLESWHPFLRATGTGVSGGGSGADRIDLMAILRASRALNSATSLAGLEEQVGDVLSAMTGATHVRLSGPSGTGPDRFVSALRYVRRTRRPLLVADACADDRFARDPYLAGLEACALLAVPVPSRDADDTVLVLENHRQGGVFSTDRLEAVRLIAGQLAVALDNALLHDSLEDTVRERTADLEAANQLKADLIGMLGHEINNPLAMILGNLDLTLSEDELPGPVRDVIVRVHRTTQRLATIVQEVLDLVSLDAGRLTAMPAPVPVADHIEAALTATATGGVPVTCPRDLVAMVQPSHLDQILTNLISNAAKYGGGATEVVARGGEPAVTIEVRDRGPGVPPEFRGRLFDRFARAPSTAGKVTGTGLGLYIVRELARANHGEVDYRPGEHGGSTFIVRLQARKIYSSAHPGETAGS